MHDTPKHHPDRRKIGRAFSLKAAHYEKYALVQRRMAERLIGQLHSIADLSRERWLDLGCGTGIFAELAQGLERPPASLVNFDISQDSLAVLRQKELPFCQLLRADIVHPPLRGQRFDLVAMSSTLQWLDDQRQALATVKSLLKPQGCFAFAVFTAGTLEKLRNLHTLYGVQSPVTFVEAEAFAAMLSQAGFRLISMERGVEKDHFPSAGALLKSLSRIGSTTLAGKRLSRTALMQLCQDYEDGCRDDEGVTADYEIAVGVARKV